MAEAEAQAGNTLKIKLIQERNVTQWTHFHLVCPSSMTGKELFDIAQNLVLGYSNMDYGIKATALKKKDDDGLIINSTTNSTLSQLKLTDNCQLKIEWDTDFSCSFCLCCMCCFCCIMTCENCCNPVNFNKDLIPQQLVKVEKGGKVVWNDGY